MGKFFYSIWSIIAFIGMVLEIIWFFGGTGIVIYFIYLGFVEGNLEWSSYIKFYFIFIVIPIVIYEVVISLLSWFLWNTFFGALQLPQKNKRGSMFKNLFAMGKSTNKAVEEDDARWRRELDIEIGKLDKNDTFYHTYDEQVWFYEQFYLFITDRTMAHPNPGIREDQEYKWTLPNKITINNDNEWFHSAHNPELIARLNRYKDLYVEGKINVYEYCKERANIQKEDDQFRHLFRY